MPYNSAEQRSIACVSRAGVCCGRGEQLGSDRFASLLWKVADYSVELLVTYHKGNVRAPWLEMAQRSN